MNVITNKRWNHNILLNMDSSNGSNGKDVDPDLTLPYDYDYDGLGDGSNPNAIPSTQLPLHPASLSPPQAPSPPSTLQPTPPHPPPPFPPSSAPSFPTKRRKRGSNKHCSYGECISDSRRLSEGSQVFFMPFWKPGNIKDGMSDAQRTVENEQTNKCKRWVNACCRKDGFSVAKVTRNTYICSLHFVGGRGPTSEHPDPVKATSSEAAIEKLVRKRKPPKKREPVAKKKETGAETTTTPASEPLAEPPTPAPKEDIAENTDFVIDSSYLGAKCETSEQSCNKETQTVYKKYELGSKIENIILKNSLVTKLMDNTTSREHQNSYGNMSLDKVLVSGAKCLHFTGLNPNQFWMLYHWLGESKNNLNYWHTGKSSMSEKRKFSLSEELYLTLLRLRRGFTLQTMAYMFDCSEGLVRNIFSTWVMLLCCHFKDFKVAMFPKRASLKKYLPSIFRKFKNIRASVDCTEFFCQMPRNYARQGNLYSSYKHHTTFKCLIAVNPNGAACFISDLYEGAVTDVHLFQTCGILDHIDPGDALLVDKGFTVQSSLLPKQATIFIPPFLGQRDSFTKEEVILTKRIAKARIHVERFNERLKKFMLINGTIPLSLAPIASQLVFVCSCLVNFQKCLCY